MSKNKSTSSFFLDLALAQFWNRRAEGTVKEKTSGLFVYFRHTQIKAFLQFLELGLGSHVQNLEKRKYSLQKAMAQPATTFSGT